MNILIKLTCLVGLAIAPILGGHGAEGHGSIESTPTIEQQIQDVESLGDADDIYKMEEEIDNAK